MPLSHTCTHSHAYGCGQQKPATPALTGLSQPLHPGTAASAPTAAQQQQDGLKIAWQYRKYMQQELPGTATAAAAPHAAATSKPLGGGGSSSNSAQRAVTAGLAREWCHSFDLTRSMTPAQLQGARLQTCHCAAGSQGSAVQVAAAAAAAFAARFRMPEGAIPGMHAAHLCSRRRDGIGCCHVCVCVCVGGVEGVEGGGVGVLGGGAALGTAESHSSSVSHPPALHGTCACPVLRRVWLKPFPRRLMKSCAVPSRDPSSVGRLLIQDLGAPGWWPLGCSSSSDSSSGGSSDSCWAQLESEVLAALGELRLAVQEANCAALVTCPAGAAEGHHTCTMHHAMHMPLHLLLPLPSLCNHGCNAR